MTDYRELIAEEQGTSNFDLELTKADKEYEQALSKIRMAKVISSEVKNNSSFPLQGCCYSEYCSLQTATALYAAGYRKQSDTVKEFAEKATARIFEGITQRFCDCYNDGLHREYPDRELSRNVLMAFDECKNIAKKEINELAAQYGKEDNNGQR